MKSLYVVFVLLLLLVPPMQCLPTAEDWFNKGNAVQELEKFDEAIVCYDEAIKIDPSNPDYWNAKGDALRYQGQRDDATDAYGEVIKAYDAILELDPTNSTVWGCKCRVLSDWAMPRFQALFNFNNTSFEAIKCYDEVIKLDPNNATLRYSRAVVLFNQGKYDEAIACYDEVIKLDPDDVDAYHVKAEALSLLGRYDEALNNFDKIFKIDPLAESEWTLWDEKARMQKDAGAERIYYLKDFYTLIDGNGVTLFLSFMNRDDRSYATPEGRLLISLYKGERPSTKIYTHLYDIKKSDYDSYVGGIAITKWISFEEMSMSGLPSWYLNSSQGQTRDERLQISGRPSTVSGRFGFQDVNGIVTAARDET